MRIAVGMVMVVSVLAACGSDAGVDSQGADATTTAAPASTDAPDTSAAETTVVDTTEAPTTSAAPTTTEEPATTTTEAATTTTEPAPTTTGEPILNGFDPPCVERESAEGIQPKTESVEPFGPLEVEPAVVVQLPAARSEDSPGSESPTATAARVNDGILVAVRGPFTQSILAVVEYSGTVRWVRCWDEEIFRVHGAPGGDRALAGVFRPGANTWYEIDLGTGEATETSTFNAFEGPVASNDTMLVFGVPGGEVIGPDASMLLFDLVEFEATPIPVPPTGLEGFPFFELTDAGDLLAIDRSGDAPAVVSMYREGSWTTDPAAIATAFDVRAEFVFGSGNRPILTGYDALGNVLWTNEDVHSWSGEGFVSAVSEDVVVIAGCPGGVSAEEEFCNRSEVAGVDLATGELRWQLPGNRGVGPVGDGYALVTDGQEIGEYWMIDTATGEQVDGQVWDDDGLFGTGCCGDDWNWTTEIGGVVIATHERVMQVFVPQGAGSGTHEVSLP